MSRGAEIIFDIDIAHVSMLTSNHPISGMNLPIERQVGTHQRPLLFGEMENDTSVIITHDSFKILKSNDAFIAKYKFVTE